MQVWIVCTSDAECTSIEAICTTKKIAERELFKVRDRLVSGWDEDNITLQKDTAVLLRKNKNYKKEDMSLYTNMYKKMIANLSGNDYEKWNNYPHEKPYIYAMEVIEK